MFNYLIAPKIDPKILFRKFIIHNILYTISLSTLEHYPSSETRVSSSPQRILVPERES